ncbi:MAG: sugar nucleotide-binding protein, partial [Pseudomonadota bacterium]
MKILTIGRVGQLGTELARQCPVGCTMTSLDLPEIDLTDPESTAAQVAAADADVVINAAAYTAVDKAESEEDLARAINAEAPAAMAKAAAAKGIPFLHVSTDYVYDGTGTAPFMPDSPTDPLNAYGRTKLAGDLGVIAAGGPHAILRTSWVFSAHGGNFVKTMLRLGRDRDKLT